MTTVILSEKQIDAIIIALEAYPLQTRTIEDLTEMFENTIVETKEFNQSYHTHDFTR